MLEETIETSAHTSRDGTLNLCVNTGVLDADVAVSVRLRRMVPSGELDANGWPRGFFERVTGSMPELARAPQGDFETRARLG
ncbi:MAG: hypothetical protein HZA93_11205 [Verrucomicrobia bacterium]|nr:hypothetical protein [Verrucomicrobiota bacterium]